MAFVDHRGQVVDVPSPPPGGSHYAAIGAFQGHSYARNAFAMGTEQEVEVLIDVLDLAPGAVVLDVGCGNGRHVAALRARGYRALGVDLAAHHLVDAPAHEGDPLPCIAGLAQALPLADQSVDALFCVCQGGFGITPELDESGVGEWSRVLRTGGSVAFTAFSQVFAVSSLAPGDAFDPTTGVLHHTAEVHGPGGARRRFDLWTATYTVPELRRLLGDHGLVVHDVAGIEVGAYASDTAVTLDTPELLVWGRRAAR